MIRATEQEQMPMDRLLDREEIYHVNHTRQSKLHLRTGHSLRDVRVKRYQSGDQRRPVHRHHRPYIQQLRGKLYYSNQS